MTGKVGALLALVALPACMDASRRVETLPVGQREYFSAVSHGPRQPYVLLQRDARGLRAYARASVPCRRDVVVTMRRDELTDIRPSESRWAGAAALFIGSGVVLMSESGETMDSFGSGLALGGVAAIAVPELAARTKRRTLGYEQNVSAMLPASCDAGALAGVRVTVRDARGSHEAIADGIGVAILADADISTLRGLYVNDEVARGFLDGRLVW